MPSQDKADVSQSVAHLLSGYHAIPGVPDELMDSSGQVRPVWSGLLDVLSAMSGDEITERMARGDQYLRDAGVFYRQYDAPNTAERDWPLSHMPVLMDEREWRTISAGLIERADLLESVMADINGPNRLVAEGHLPSELVAGNPEWLRPLVGVTPRSGNYLHIVAFDIGRGPHGEWWVIGDRTQAPSGAGFALENRIATARVFSESYAASNVHRLAGFFRHFRDALNGLREHDDSRVGIFTPGPMNDTYFEHAYIARYLGFMLLEGEDMTVHNGRLMVRTVDGLRPISVLWRRLDSLWTDPLELDETSKIGTPGLLEAVRSGSVTMVNALGSGILETRAMLAFLPRISEVLSGKPLSIPNIATWWCGQAKERETVKENAAQMTIGNAYATGLLFDASDIFAVGGTFNRATKQSLESWIDEGAGQLVGQEALTLSTTPVLVNGKLAPRPMSLRVFLARSGDGWQVMPGGFARIGPDANTAILTMQHGGSAADMWIVSDKPVAQETMLSSPSAPFVRQQPGVLPSRAAENLYWLGRYVERAENLIRLMRAYNSRWAETPVEDTAVLRALSDYMTEIGCDPADGFPTGIASALQSASGAAGSVRDRFSVDGWMALADLSRTVEQLQKTARPGSDSAAAMSILLRKLSGFSGLVHENMYRFTGWRFLSLGRSLERASDLLASLARFTDAIAPEGSLDLAIEIADSAMTHRRRYSVATNRATVVDLLALDPLNPRSVIYQFDEMAEHFGFLPGTEPHRPMTEFQRQLLKARTALAVQTPETLSTEILTSVGDDTAILSELLAKAYFR